MITKETASKIWNCHNEIEKANNLIASMKEQLEKYGDTLIPDAFGNREGLSLGVPTSSSGCRLFNVPPEIALKVIDAHVELQNAKLADLMTVASLELR